MSEHLNRLKQASAAMSALSVKAKLRVKQASQQKAAEGEGEPGFDYGVEVADAAGNSLSTREGAEHFINALPLTWAAGAPSGILSSMGVGSALGGAFSPKGRTVEHMGRGAGRGLGVGVGAPAGAILSQLLLAPLLSRYAGVDPLVAKGLSSASGGLAGGVGGYMAAGKLMGPSSADKPKEKKKEPAKEEKPEKAEDE